MSKYCKCKIQGSPKNKKMGNKFVFVCVRCKKPRKITIRRKWHRKPQTQIKKSDKIYNRKRAKRKFRRRLKGE